MTVEQFVAVRELLGYDSNLALGAALGYSRTQYQCKQIENIVTGKTEIKRLLVLGLECLSRRKGLYSQFRAIMGDSYPP